MTQMSIEQALELGLKHQKSGDLGRAESVYRQLLQQYPKFPMALNLLGGLMLQTGRAPEALELLKKAVELEPSRPLFHASLGSVLRANGRPDEAIAELEIAISLEPRYIDAMNQLGLALWECGRLDEAIAQYRRTIGLAPNFAAPHSNLANALSVKGELDEAIFECREALRIDSRSAVTFNNLGSFLLARGRAGEAVEACRKAIEMNPRLSGAYSNAAIAYFECGRLDEAAAACREGLRLQPDLQPAYTNLGNVLRETGDVDGALANYRRALEIAPGDSATHSNLLFTLYLKSECTEEELLAEHRRWAQKFSETAESIPPANDLSPGRRLRIGYVSSFLRDQPVGRFLAPLLASHDRSHFEVFCYSNSDAEDALSDKLRQSADHWKNIRHINDAAVAATIRDDQIDILIDLNLHGANNRMRLFAMKPAPVQATYLAYPGTSGMAAMDYRITDRYLDPPDLRSAPYPERPAYLSKSYWCYDPSPAAADVNALPADAAGHVTFGCLNSLSKVGRDVLNAWREILAGAANSRLLIHAAAGEHRQKIAAFFAERGIGPERIEFVPRLSPEEYFALYHRIDIALDPFPCGGAATTCDALWMGVPVVTLSGKATVGRAGVSILSNVGLQDWIAGDVDQYISIARQAAVDLPKLRDLRGGLRRRMLASPLTDAKAFAADFEGLLRQLWSDHCAGRGAGA
jgi:predicted O-linked N-acetylglucosamine transferase (SPINDLY family)